MTLTYKIYRVQGTLWRVILLDQQKHIEVGWHWKVNEVALRALQIELPGPFLYEPWTVELEV